MPVVISSGVLCTFVASALDSVEVVVIVVVVVAAVDVVAAAAAFGAAFGGCTIVVMIEVGVTEFDVECSKVFKFILYKYESYSASGSEII